MFQARISNEVDTEFAGFLCGLADFVAASPTSYHAANELAAQIRQAGFKQILETDSWTTVSGKYFVVRDGAVMAWVCPQKLSNGAGYKIVGSHTDSPAFKLKPNAVSTNYGWQQVGMEIYGGGLNNSWLDRDLGLAGRLTTLDGQVHLVRTEAILRISQLAPHLDRSVNDGLELKRQQHLLPILAVNRPEIDIEAYLCKLAGIAQSDLAYHDIYSYSVEPSATLGLENDFFVSARLDNLSSVYASLVAFLQQAETVMQGDHIAVLAAFDHEEVGSATRSGAAGPFLEDILVRIADGLGIRGSEYRKLLALSSCISADAGHAIHPNYAGKHDPNNRPLINKGPLLKLNANQRYASDAVGASIWLQACQRAGVPTQHFVSNNEVPCGSTIGPITATRIGITTVDVGVPILSMHSVREMAGVADMVYLSKALMAYWD